MPIYEYKCKDCGEISEVLVRSGEDDLIRCKKCGSDALERVISSAFAVVGSESLSSEGASCCGLTNPCDNPKRCCTRGG